MASQWQEHRPDNSVSARQEARQVSRARFALYQLSVHDNIIYFLEQ